MEREWIDPEQRNSMIVHRCRAKNHALFLPMHEREVVGSLLVYIERVWVFPWSTSTRGTSDK